MSDTFSPLIAPFAEKYIALAGAGRFKVAFQTLNKGDDTHSLLYNDEEAEILATALTKQTDLNYSGIEVDGISIGNTNNEPPILQLYDFIATMRKYNDDMKILMKILDEPNFKDKKEDDVFKRVQRQIPPSDLRPEAFHRTFPATIDDDALIGQPLFEPLVFALNTLYGTSVPSPFSKRIVKKTRLELAHDEAHLLQYTMVGTYFAIAQGLFRVGVTPVNEINLGRMQVQLSATVTEDHGVGSTNWAQSLQHSGASRAYNASNPITTGDWVNGTTNTGNDVWCNVKEIIVGHPYYDILVVMPKDTDIKRYAKNRFHQEFVQRKFITAGDAMLYEPYKSSITVDKALGLQPQDSLKRGGAIGMFKLCKPGGALIPTTGVVVKIQAVDVLNAMDNMRWHPIHACSNLSRAFKESGMLEYFRDQLMTVISKNKLPEARYRDASMRTPDDKYAAHTSIAGGLWASKKERTKLRPGRIPRFRDANGHPVLASDAYELNSSSGQLILRNDVQQTDPEGVPFTVTITRPILRPDSEYIPVQYNSRDGQPMRLFVHSNSQAALLLQHYGATRHRQIAIPTSGSTPPTSQ